MVGDGYVCVDFVVINFTTTATIRPILTIFTISNAVIVIVIVISSVSVFRRRRRFYVYVYI